MAQQPPAGGNGQYGLKLTPVPIGNGHRTRVRPNHLSGHRVCTTCHDAALDTQVTHTHWSHGRDDGDAWYDSSYNGHGTHTPWPADEKSCQSCHMPRVQASHRERGAKNGWVRDHRFLGANSALARLDNRVHQVNEITAFMKDRIQLSLMQSLDGTVDVVLFNAAVGHRFPGGVNDNNDVWLEIEMRDEAGHVVGEHGTRLKMVSATVISYVLNPSTLKECPLPSGTYRTCMGLSMTPQYRAVGCVLYGIPWSLGLRV